jgi:hypothetical protein
MGYHNKRCECQIPGKCTLTIFKFLIKYIVMHAFERLAAAAAVHTMKWKVKEDAMYRCHARRFHGKQPACRCSTKGEDQHWDRKHLVLWRDMQDNKYEKYGYV